MLTSYIAIVYITLFSFQKMTQEAMYIIACLRVLMRESETGILGKFIYEGSVISLLSCVVVVDMTSSSQSDGDISQKIGDFSSGAQSRTRNLVQRTGNRKLMI